LYLDYAATSLGRIVLTPALQPSSCRTPLKVVILANPESL
jgi:hypothetical protein